MNSSTPIWAAISISCITASSVTSISGPMPLVIRPLLPGTKGRNTLRRVCVVQGVDAVVEIPNHQTKLQRRRGYRFPGIQHPQGGGGRRGPALNDSRGRAAGGSVVQIKFEAVAPRKGQGANQVLSRSPGCSG